ncbi:WD40 repeat-like protein [Sistotremastrum suecicum HHB10207 ss-3]|uniref:WD40 repeat-like protein n=1 Tax=Sistotremastrum suecicum HHB10207 ss-3 TaxID=1314776 RepID=A0A166DSU2_9AGAM|nr:WD40 repeat-like protein [Sistotremastrum suecicum HHB10207 ss-3]
MSNLSNSSAPKKPKAMKKILKKPKAIYATIRNKDRSPSPSARLPAAAASHQSLASSSTSPVIPPSSNSNSLTIAVPAPSNSISAPTHISALVPEIRVVPAPSHLSVSSFEQARAHQSGFASSSSTTPLSNSELVHPNSPTGAAESSPQLASSSSSNTAIQSTQPHLRSLAVSSPDRATSVEPQEKPIAADVSSNPHSRFSSALGVGWQTFRTALRILKESADFNPILKSVLGGVFALVEAAELTRSNREQVQMIAKRVKAITDTITQYQLSPLPAVINGRLDELAAVCEKEAKKLEIKKKHNAARRFAEGSKDASDTLDSMRAITDACDTYLLKAGVNIEFKVEGIYDVVISESQRKLLDKLNPAASARFDVSLEGLQGVRAPVSRGACTANTRQEILKELSDWTEDYSAPNIYWLNGMAGTGKTTIAYSLCNLLKDKGMLGASFFCSRYIEECTHANRIIPTIVHALATHHPQLASSIARALEGNCDLTDTVDLQKQFKALFLDILQQHKTRLVIVIDALDECSNVRNVRSLLDIIFLHSPSLPVKFFITCRPGSAFTGYHKDQLDRLCSLHDIDEKIVQTDITTYLRYIQVLAARAKTLFVNDWDVDLPQQRLLLGPLDTLYAKVLEDRHCKLTNKERHIMFNLMHTIITVRVPLTIQGLARLLAMKPDHVNAHLRAIQSVIHISPGENGKVSPFHASFPDFLTTRERSKRFFCHPSTSHLQLAKQCFMAIADSWKMHGHVSLQSSSQLANANSDERLHYACVFWAPHLTSCMVDDEIQHMLDCFLKTQVLHWMEYLQSCNQIKVAVDSFYKVQQFMTFNQDLLSRVIDAWKFVLESLQLISTHPPEIYRSALLWLPALSYIRQHYMQTQYSWPRLSGIDRQQWDVFQGILTGHSSDVRSVAFSLDGSQIVSGSYDETVCIWSAATGVQLQILEGHTDWVKSVAFSPDGSQVVSGSDDKTVRIWNATTGAQLQTLEGHTDWVNSVAFSPDGSQIVSGSDDKTAHNSWVNSVAFSPDGTQIVSGSHDETVCIWSAATGAQLQTLEGHTDEVNCVAFSPDGSQIVSGSDDKTVRTWSAASGAQLQTLKGHTHCVNSVAFSPDCTQIVSGSGDMTVRIWSAATGAQLQTLEDYIDEVNCVAFSLDGSQIVSGYKDRTVRIWSATTEVQLLGALSCKNWKATVARWILTFSLMLLAQT